MNFHRQESFAAHVSSRNLGYGAARCLPHTGGDLGRAPRAPSPLQDQRGAGAEGFPRSLPNILL